jgi:hypothetical protein
MIFVGGRRLMGCVEAHAGTFVVTQFLHIYYMPVFPLQSHLVLESGVGPGGIRRSVPIRLHTFSVLAGYLRPWLTVAACFCLLGAVMADPGLPELAWGVAGGALTLAAMWTWTRLGRLSPEAIAQRRVYAALTRESVDAALLCRTADAFRSSLLASVAEGARGMLATSYRASFDPEREWVQVALDPTVRDRAFLQACFTLARIEWARAVGTSRAKLADQHTKIWEKLTTLDAAGLPSRALTVPSQRSGAP